MVQPAETKLENAIEYTLFLNPPHEAIIIPPKIMPIEKVISIAVNLHTSFPKLLVT
ncbi:hypothetical protein D3C81_1918650 [compost metagenome]